MLQLFLLFLCFCEVVFSENAFEFFLAADSSYHGCCDESKGTNNEGIGACLNQFLRSNTGGIPSSAALMIMQASVPVLSFSASNNNDNDNNNNNNNNVQVDWNRYNSLDRAIAINAAWCHEHKYDFLLVLSSSAVSSSVTPILRNRINGDADDGDDPNNDWAGVRLLRRELPNYERIVLMQEDTIMTDLHKDWPRQVLIERDKSRIIICKEQIRFGAPLEFGAVAVRSNRGDKSIAELMSAWLAPRGSKSNRRGLLPERVLQDMISTKDVDSRISVFSISAFGDDVDPRDHGHATHDADATILYLGNAQSGLKRVAFDRAYEALCNSTERESKSGLGMDRWWLATKRVQVAQQVVEQSPESVDAMLQLSIALLDPVAGPLGWRKSVSIAKQAVQFGGSTTTLLVLAAALRKISDFQGAFQSLQMANSKAESAQIHGAIAELLIQLRKTSDAIIRLQRATEMAPWDTHLAFIYATQLLLNRTPGKAMIPLRRVTQLDPGHGEAWANLGFACQLEGNLADAAAAYRRSLDRGIREMSRARHGLGKVLLKLGQPGAALVELEKTYNNANEKERTLTMYLDLSDAKVLTGDVHGALQLLEECQKHYTNNALVIQKVAKILELKKNSREHGVPSTHTYFIDANMEHDL